MKIPRLKPRSALHDKLARINLGILRDYQHMQPIVAMHAELAFIYHMHQSAQLNQENSHV